MPMERVYRELLRLEGRIHASHDTELLHPEVQGRAVQSQAGCGTTASGEDPVGLLKRP